MREGAGGTSAARPGDGGRSVSRQSPRAPPQAKPLPQHPWVATSPTPGEPWNPGGQSPPGARGRGPFSASPHGALSLPHPSSQPLVDIESQEGDGGVGGGTLPRGRAWRPAGETLAGLGTVTSGLHAGASRPSPQRAGPAALGSLGQAPAAWQAASLTRQLLAAAPSTRRPLLPSGARPGGPSHGASVLTEPTLHARQLGSSEGLGPGKQAL